MKIGSLFAGIGGFDLAASWLGWETAWYSEIDPYASSVMKKRFPLAPNLGDITKIDGKQAAPVDLLCGGFPCQDISLAGKGAGLSGERSGLWSHYRRLIEEVAPRWVVIENVSALRSRGLDRVLGEIAALGYDAEWHCIPAAAVGAPHRRDRVWIIAHAQREQSGERCGTPLFGGRQGEAEQVRLVGSGKPVADTASEPESESGHEAEAERGERHARLVVSGSGAGLISTAACADLADPLREQSGERCGTPLFGGRQGEVVCERPGEQPAQAGGSQSAPDVPNADDAGQSDVPLDADAWRSLPESPRGHGWWATEPDVGRVAHGVPSRVDRLRCLGNAIVPQVAFVIFSAIARAEAA